MRSLAELLRTGASRFVGRPDEVEAALGVLGPAAANPIEQLAPSQKLRLTDLFVRNLRSLPVSTGAELERSLLHAVDARVDEVWDVPLDGPRSVIAVREHLRLALISAGMPWASIARLQACVCMLVNWLSSSGGGSFQISPKTGGIRVRLTTSALGGDPALFCDTPMVSALREQSPDLRATRGEGQLVVEFSLVHGAC